MKTKNTFEFNGRIGYLDGYLMNALDSMVYNIKNDWDFVILITGNRMVRVGKSVLGMNIAAYLAYRISMYCNVNIPYSVNDIYFDSDTMIKEAQKKPKFSVNHYDEARESLAATKHMSKLQQDLIDFFNECGQLNQIFILVLPDFFSLKEEVAVGRSECLINTYKVDEPREVRMYKGEDKKPVVKFVRGKFQFFSRYKKANLYDKYMSTRKKDYMSKYIRSDFVGSFRDHYLVDKQEYLQSKKDALARFNEKKRKEKEGRSDTLQHSYVINKRKNGLTTDEVIGEMEKDFGKSYHKKHIEKIWREYNESTRKMGLEGS